ncbi:MAG: SDR family NAD(P)-dependent oxidoreductase [Nevskia sp.]|nr:SDR family NAD(P)-dependent oxidoreductase [Nevskia sp.]
MTQLAGKVVWITGASSGIGEALAVLASRRGARLVLSARRAAELERVKGLCSDPAKVAVLPLDLADFDAADAAARAAAPFGPVGVLVNNAGVSQRSLFKDTGLGVYRSIMELDFFAPVALTQAVLPGMRQRGDGHVVMMGSVVSKIGGPLRTGYSAAKHALAGFTEAARAELWRDGIRFTLACPGYVRTQVSVNALDGSGGKHGVMDPSTGHGLEPGNCAERIWRAVEKDREELLIAGREGVYVQLKRFAPSLFSYALKRATKLT